MSNIIPIIGIFIVLYITLLVCVRVEKLLLYRNVTVSKRNRVGIISVGESGMSNVININLERLKRTTTPDERVKELNNQMNHKIREALVNTQIKTPGEIK